MRFPGLIGNESLKRRLSTSSGKFSHCYILEGPSGSGKKTLARILAAAMECEGSGDFPCGQCSACRKVFGDVHPDVITVDSSTATIPIRLIRNMQTDAYVKPNEGKKKIYIIPRAQDMQTPAQNALLKLLEEPPVYCSFLLLTDSSEKLLETVRSRAVILSMSPLGQSDLEHAIREKEPNISREDLLSAMEKSDGYLGAALNILHAPETEQDLQVTEILSAFASGDELQLLSALQPLEKLSRQDMLSLLENLYRSLIHSMTSKSDILSGCSRSQINAAVQSVSGAVTYMQANGSTALAVGSLLAQMRPVSQIIYN